MSKQYPGCSTDHDGNIPPMGTTKRAHIARNLKTKASEGEGAVLTCCHLVVSYTWLWSCCYLRPLNNHMEDEEYVQTFQSVRLDEQHNHAHN